MRRLMILEDEEVLRGAMARALSKLDGVQVVAVGTVDEAIRAFRESRPAVIVSDLDLPDGSGLQLLTEIQRTGGGIPVIFVSAYLAELNEWIPRRPEIEVRSKPIELDVLRTLVSERLNTGKKPQEAFSVDDYVQLACMGRHAMLIKLEDSNELIGEIYVRSGEVWSAVDTKGEGFEALERMRRVVASVQLEPQWESSSLPRNVHIGSHDLGLLAAEPVGVGVGVSVGAGLGGEVGLGRGAVEPPAPPPPAPPPLPTPIPAEPPPRAHGGPPPASSARPRPTAPAAPPLAGAGTLADSVERYPATELIPGAEPPSEALAAHDTTVSYPAVESALEPDAPLYPATELADFGVPATEAVPPLAEVGEDTFESWLERAVAAVIERDYEAALGAYLRAEALDPGQTIVRTNIERLRGLVKRQEPL